MSNELQPFADAAPAIPLTQAVKKLAYHKAAQDVAGRGGSIGEAFGVLMDFGAPELRDALEWAVATIAAVREMPAMSGKSDEQIVAEILRKVKEAKRRAKAARRHDSGDLVRPEALL